MGRPRATNLTTITRGVEVKYRMAEKIHDNQLSDKLDAFLNAGCDFARACFQSWLARQDQARQDQGEASRRSAAEPSPAPSDEPLMTVEEMAGYLKIKPQTLRDWVKKGRIPYEPVNSEIRFRRSVIDKWIDAKKAKQSSPTSDNGVELGRSFLRPQNHRSKSNGRV